MKIMILAATAALLATPVLAQSPAVQGRSGSTAGGYLTDAPNSVTGGYADDGVTTGAVAPRRGGALGGQSDAMDLEDGTVILVPQELGARMDGAVVPRR